jgi:TRAP-type C4-dicarboxylate transport system permease small subunit
VRKISELATAFVKHLDWLIQRVLFIFLFVMTVVTFTQVCTRYILGFSFLWGEELCRYLFVWSVFIAFPSLIFHSGLTSFDMLLRRTGEMAGKILKLIIALGEIFFLGLLCIGGYPLMIRQWAQRATSLPVSMGLVYVVVPLSACLSMFVVVERILYLFRPEAKPK